MSTGQSKSDRLTRVLRIIARIWSLVIIAIGMLILAGEVYGAVTGTQIESPPYPWWENLIPLTLGISILGLAIAWRWEGIGAAVNIGFVALNLVLYILTGRGEVVTVMLILAPVVIPGLMFLVLWYRDR